MSGLFARCEPIHSLFPSWKCGEITPGKAFEILVEDFGQALGADPCGTLDVGTVKGKRFFDAGSGGLVHVRIREIGECEDGVRGERGDLALNLVDDQDDLLGGETAEINQHDCLSAVFDELDAVVHETALSF